MNYIYLHINQIGYLCCKYKAKNIISKKDGVRKAGRVTKISAMHKCFQSWTVIAVVAMFIISIAHAQTESQTQRAVQPIIVTDTYNSLEEAIKPLRGKKIYVDIWATWCKPCLMEFAHNEVLEKMLTENDIQQLFISFGDEEKNWKDYIKQYNLTGTHIRATGGFGMDILKLFFTNSGGSVSIPRYILIDEKGKIINKNAKRPSELVAGEQL